MGELTTGLDVCAALVRMAVQGDETAIAVVRAHADAWVSNWPIIAQRVLHDREMWSLPDDATHRLRELAPRAPKPVPRPCLAPGTPPATVLARCAEWARQLGDDSTAIGAVIRCARDHGVGIDTPLARQLLSGRQEAA